METFQVTRRPYNISLEEGQSISRSWLAVIKYYLNVRAAAAPLSKQLSQFHDNDNIVCPLPPTIRTNYLRCSMYTSYTESSIYFSTRISPRRKNQTLVVSNVGIITALQHGRTRTQTNL